MVEKFRIFSLCQKVPRTKFMKNRKPLRKSLELFAFVRLRKVRLQSTQGTVGLPHPSPSLLALTMKHLALVSCKHSCTNTPCNAAPSPYGIQASLKSSHGSDEGANVPRWWWWWKARSRPARAVCSLLQQLNKLAWIFDWQFHDLTKDRVGTD